MTNYKAGSFFADKNVSLSKSNLENLKNWSEDLLSLWDLTMTFYSWSQVY